MLQTDSHGQALNRIVKRDGRIVDFDKSKITEAIWKAIKSVGGQDRALAERLSNQVVERLGRQLKPGEIPHVEQVQDLVEKVLVENNLYNVAKAYILYRALHAQIREFVDSYLENKSWLVKENANTTYSLQALNFHISSQVISQYWLHRIFNKSRTEIREAHLNGDFHIHNLGILGPYCFDDQTRVLTKEGFKFFKDITLQDEVATVNLKTGYLEYQHPLDKQVFEYSGPLFCFESRSLSLRVTPEHRLLVREKGDGKWKFVSSTNFKRRSEFLKQVKWRGKNSKFFQIPMVKGGNRLRHLEEIPIEVFLKFMGWYLAEGNAWKHDRKDRNSPNYIISIGQRDKKNRREITSLIKRLGFSPNLSEKDHIQFCSKELYFYLKQFGKSNGKFVPQFIKDLDPEKIEIFLFSLFKGDGTIENGKLRRFSTKSKKLAEDVLECLLKIGKSGTLRWDGRRFIVSVQTEQLTPIFNKRPKLVQYKGKVYDLTVPNGTLLVERNGKVVVSGNCVGWDLKDLLTTGFRGVRGKVSAKPAKHFRVALGQVVNFVFTLQGEAAGAQAFSNFDTYLAPFIRYDNLDYKSVKQALQEFLFNMNIPTRVGFQTPFSNITLDLKVPKFMEDEPVVVGGDFKDESYGDFQEEMNVFNKALAEVMLEGDAVGRVFTFPIPTINITRDFNWDEEAVRKVLETSAKYGIPYFANFVNSDMSPEDVRSMCCHLRLDKRELKKRGGGLFGANPLTGSIGVVTINMPRIGFLSKSEGEFFARLDRIMVLAKDVLEIKRKWLEKFTEAGLYPYSRFYLRQIKEAFGHYWKNHFGTIGLIGMNEACLNFLGCSIGDPEGFSFAIKVLDYMRKRLQDFQEETGEIFNLEATPAEGTSHRLARIDKKTYPGIIVANEEEVKRGAAPYYTNSTHLPVYYTDDLWEYLRLQDPLQTRYTGGTVVHVWLGESNPPVESVASLVRKICENFKLPYFTLTPTFSICPEDGYLSGEQPTCPKCGRTTEVYSRVVGYLRPVEQWNQGKQEEFKQRKVFDKAFVRKHSISIASDA